MLSRLLYRIVLFFSRNPRVLPGTVAGLVVLIAVSLIGTKAYQWSDRDQQRGAIPIANGAFGEDYATPIYLDQGWDENDSLWFYNTTQGSGLMPYDFFLVLEQKDSEELFRSDANIDRFRYLPQEPTGFNPDGLPVGLVKDEYQGNDYVGFTCAACHTGQVNFKGQAIRIDGGPAMADMVTFLRDLQKALEATRDQADKRARFVSNVLALDQNYGSEKAVLSDLAKWTDVITLYNIVNRSTYKGIKLEYGYARLDAFGRIYNRVVQHVINKKQVRDKLARASDPNGRRILNNEQIDKVLDEVGETILGDDEFSLIVDRLLSGENGNPRLGLKDFLYVRNEIFNPPNAPVSYPFLWDIAQSDYVQWNGLASNAPPGPLGRNAGEVIGVFGILDWQEDERWLTRLAGFSLSGFISGQDSKRKQVHFKSSIDLFNLQRLESHLRTLQSPKWPFCRREEGGHNVSYYLSKSDDPNTPPEERVCSGNDEMFDEERVERGKVLYARLCESCHEVIDREDWDRKVIAKMSSLRKVRTDPAMARNGVGYLGKSGNFEHTYQGAGVGPVIVETNAPVAEILTAATKGVLATPDPDKWFFQRWAEWAYVLVMSFADNSIKSSVKKGDYDPDTTAEPYRSLLAYKARSLNGIWATAPYLHNGSVPTLYDLLLPAKTDDGGAARPAKFLVGAREFDPEKVGFVSDGYDGFVFDTSKRGNRNTGHEYGAGKLSHDERLDLLEYLKTL